MAVAGWTAKRLFDVQLRTAPTDILSSTVLGCFKWM